MTITNRRIHAPSAPVSWAEQRDVDAGLFEDWSAGEDQWGLWLWPEPIWHAYVVRPAGATMAARISRLGGVRIAQHRYDEAGRRDWLVSDRRWRDLRAALPELVKLRRAYFREQALRALGDWEPFRIAVAGRSAWAAYSRADRAFAQSARALGAKFHAIFGRSGWSIPVDAPTAQEFLALVAERGRGGMR